MTGLRPRSGYDVVALLAFLLAVGGGGAYAATQKGAADIKKNAVHTNHIKDGAVHHADLAPDSVGTVKVVDGTLLPRDLAAGLLPRGALSFDTHITDGSTPSLPAIEGVVLKLVCDTDASTRIGLEFDAKGPGDLTITGSRAIDAGGPSHLDATGSSAFIIANPGSSVDVDVMVRLGTAGKWVNFQAAAGFAGAGNGCNFGGLITPPSN